MAYFRTNTAVPVNIRMITSAGVPVTGLTQPQILLTLIRAGITQNIFGLYSIAEQQLGVYRVVFDPTLMSQADTDYVLIAQDSTLHALNDTIEFTLYNESIDTVKTALDTTSASIMNQLTIIESYTDEVEPLLKNATYGLSAIKTILDALSTQIAVAESSILGDINSSSSSQTTLLNQIISSQSSNQTALLSQFVSVLNQLSIVASYTDTLEPLLNNATYGLSALKTELDTILSNLAVDFSNIQAALTSTSGVTNGKVDNVSAQVNAAINDILVNKNLLDTIVSYVDTIQPTLDNATYGLSALKTELDTIITNDSLNTTSINSNIVSSTGVTNTKVDLVNTNLLNDFNALTSQIGTIPTDPLRASDPLALNLAKLDTTVSSISLQTAQQVWSYANRFLTGASGLNQIDVYGIDMQFAVGKDVIINVALIDALGYAVTGRTYPGTLQIGLWKTGIPTDSSGLLTITSVETAPGVYRTTIPGALLNVAATDYLLVLDDLLLAGLTQRTEFSVFNVTGVSEPKVVTIRVQDSFTLLPIPDTQIYFKDPLNTAIINKGLTDVSGNFNTGLADGTYNVFLRKTFVDFTVPEQLIVVSDTTAVYLGTSFSPSNPTSPSTCVVYGWISGVDGIPIRNAKVSATDPLSSRYSGSYKIGKVTKATSTDINGYWELELIKTSQLIPTGVPYQVTQTYPGFSYEHDIIVPDSSSVNFSTL